MNLLLSDPAFLAASGGISGPSDPYFSNVSLLLHGDGTNGSTTILDSSPSPKTITAFGNAQISTAQSKFGGASIAFDGSGDYLQAPSSSDWAFGTGDFTVEAWIYAISFSNFATITGNLASNSDTSWMFNFMFDGRVRFQNWNNVIAESSAGSISLNTWTHMAVTRSNSTTRLFVNGSNLDESTISLNYSLINNLGIGKAPGIATTFNGYIDDLRITKGVARYTSNFTPPTAPFPDA